MGLLDFFRISRIKSENEQLRQEVSVLQKKLDSLGFTEYTETQAALDILNEKIGAHSTLLYQQQERLTTFQIENERAATQLATQQKKLSRIKELFYSIDYCIKNYHDSSSDISKCTTDAVPIEEIEEFSPSVILKLHCMDAKSLRKAYRDNDKQINRVLEHYAARYTTKANKAIYQLMVIALRAELQNILYNLKYQKLEEAEMQVKNITAKYLKIAGDGNQSISGTLTRFIGEIEYFFLNAVKIEYNYYVKKEQARQEQLALREQMRQEAAEKKALELERKRIEREEEKYQKEINRITEQLRNAADAEVEKLKAQILSLQSSLSDVAVKKDEITSLQNGKAGSVYVISNLGSFGENVFKIGMTRRLDPQERIDELGSASVPFKFDVHSFIFSENAVELENKLHDKLNSKRVNKVNLRKEFFYTTIEELEKMVNEIDPTAEFNRTMVAEEFRQSQSSDSAYTSDYSPSDPEDE